MQPRSPNIVRRMLLVLLLLAPSFAPAWSQTAQKPKIVIIGTGGTIAGAGHSSANANAYQSAVVAVDKLISSLPEIKNVADVKGEQIFQIGSESFNNERLLRLAHRISDLLKSKDVDGIVVTHGTDTLEETSYFLYLTIKSDKPVVLVGSMRPGTALSADGPLNLYNAVVVASDKSSAGKGTLVVMNDEIHSARDVTKTSSVKIEAFRSLYGPIGTVVESQVRFYRLPSRPHNLQSEFDIDRIQSLPEVNVVYTHENMSRVPYDAFVAAGSKAIIHMGFGNGSVPDYIDGVLKEVRAKGVFVVRATRTGSGLIVRNGETDDDKNDYIVVDDQNPAKARLLMALALTETSDTKELQNIFWKY
ncbi:MAG TPA: asparaginase [Steroidobacteraceae bacterium]|nr:asparaginase [Steroidobacteraceae bacterium]